MEQEKKRETVSARFQRIKADPTKYQAYLACGRRAYQKLKEDPERCQKRLEQVRNRRHKIEKDAQSYRQLMSKEEVKPKIVEEDKSTFKEKAQKYQPVSDEDALRRERTRRLDAIYADTTLTSEEKDEKAKEAFRWFQNTWYQELKKDPEHYQKHLARYRGYSKARYQSIKANPEEYKRHLAYSRHRYRVRKALKNGSPLPSKHVKHCL